MDLQRTGRFREGDIMQPLFRYGSARNAVRKFLGRKGSTGSLGGRLRRKNASAVENLKERPAFLTLGLILLSPHIIFLVMVAMQDSSRNHSHAPCVRRGKR